MKKTFKTLLLGSVLGMSALFSFSAHAVDPNNDFNNYAGCQWSMYWASGGQPGVVNFYYRPRLFTSCSYSHLTVVMTNGQYSSITLR